MTSNNKAIARFVLWFLLVYSLLMAPWPGLQNTYRTAYVGAGQFVFQTLTSPDTIRFKAPDVVEREVDTVVLVTHRGAAGWLTLGINSRQGAYLPTVVLASLILATPVPWSRRGASLLLGLVLVHLFIAVRLTIVVLSGYYLMLGPNAGTETSLWTKVVLAGVKFAATGQGLGYIVPTIIWVLVAIPREQLNRILSKRPLKRPGIL